MMQATLITAKIFAQQEKKNHVAVTFLRLIDESFQVIIAELPRAPKAPAGGASIGIEINKLIKARKFGCRLRTYNTFSSLSKYVRY